MERITASVPVTTPPAWAVQQRLLLQTMERSALPFWDRYVRDDGELYWDSFGGVSPDDYGYGGSSRGRPAGATAPYRTGTTFAPARARSAACSVRGLTDGLRRLGISESRSAYLISHQTDRSTAATTLPARAQQLFLAPYPHDPAA